jgi:hypothetical protein
MTSRGISYEQWMSRFGGAKLPRFRDDGVPVRDTLAHSAFAITTPTPEEIARSEVPAPWPGVIAVKLSGKGAYTEIHSMIVLLELEDIQAINNASDKDLEFIWWTIEVTGQEPQVET